MCKSISFIFEGDTESCKVSCEVVKCYSFLGTEYKKSIENYKLNAFNFFRLQNISTAMGTLSSPSTRHIVARNTAFANTEMECLWKGCDIIIFVSEGGRN